MTNDFETAVDQFLADADGDADFESYENDNYVEFEGLDDDFDDDELDDLDDLDDELELYFSGENEGDFESYSEFEFDDADIDDDDDDELEWYGESESYLGDFESGAAVSMLSEAEVEELARDLVGVSTTDEMEAFFKKIGRAFRNVGKKLGKKVLKAGSGLIGRALPIVGSSLGTALLPGVGTALGGSLGGQLRNLFSRRGRRSLGRSLTRQAVKSARRLGRRNPLSSLLGRRGGQALKSLFGFEAESAYGDPQLDVARRVVRTMADAADIASRSDSESDAAVSAAYRTAAERNLPPAVRAAMLTGPTT